MRTILVVAGVVLAVSVTCLAGGVFDTLTRETTPKDGVREITYAQFMQLRDAQEPYVLLDVLSPDSFQDGHIPDSRNLPMSDITAGTAQDAISPGTNVVVYCGGFSCGASTAAAHVLQDLGYRVLDYKGGLKDWVEQGNALAQ